MTTTTDCYCRGAAVCGHCGEHSCTDCQCDDIDFRKDSAQ